MQEKDINSINEIKIYPPPHETEIGESQTTRVRDERIDAVKFWAIVLVIAVHVLNRKVFADSTACTVVWKWCLIFAMPLFIFISGYFSRKKDKESFWPSIWKILEPLIIFHILTRVIPHIRLYGFYGIELRAILTPGWAMWYLFSLIYWRLMLQSIPDKILNNAKLIMICTFCVSILAGFLPFDRFLSIQRTLAYMPFFFLGYYMKGKNLYLPDKYKPFCVVFLIAMFAIPLFFPHFLSLLNSTPYENYHGALKRMFVFSLAIPMSIAFINVCYNTPWIARQGKMSMQYYIYHVLIIPPFFAIVDKLNIPMSFATAAVITLLITIGIIIILRIPYVKMLTNPSSFLE